MALAALGWVLTDEDHAERLLTLTGITPEELRARLAEPAVLAEVLDFLLRHEPDLIACAHSLGVKPEALVAAHHKLSGGADATDWGA